MIAGICGILSLNSHVVDPDRLSVMMQYFGSPAPPVEFTGGWYCLAQAGYNSTGYEGACLLAESNLTVCFEGRIDNRRSLIQQLEEDVSCSYARLILKAYQKWNTAFASHILGAFTCVLIDTNLHLALFSTDHLGLRTLYYHQGEDEFVFGADIRQVLAGANLAPTIQRNKILEFLSPIQVIDEGWLNPDSTFFTGVKHFPHAHSLLLKRDGTIRWLKYWEPPKRLDRNMRSPEEFAANFQKVFYEVVTDHLDTFHPIGADLSGGIDSGSLVFVAQDILQQSGRANHSFHTYTLAYNFKMSQDDVARVRYILQRYPSITGHIIEADDLIGPLENGPLKAYRSVLRPCLMNIPESYVALTRTALRDGCKLLLTGEGADYYLEGTDVIWDSAFKGGNWKYIKQAFSTLRSRGHPRLLAQYLLEYAIPPLLPFGISRRAYVKEYYDHVYKRIYPDLFSDTFASSLNSLLQQQREVLLKNESFECWSQRLEHELLFPPNHIWQGIPVDIEVRHPYFDRRLLDFGLSVPPEFKFEFHQDKISHYGSRKVLQRKGLKSIVPPEILESQIKATYGSPAVRRLRAHLPQVFTEPRQSLVAQFDIIQAEKFREAAWRVISDEHISDADEILPWLNAVLHLELWLQATFEEMPSTRLL